MRPVSRPRVLLLHGLSSRGESKAAFLRFLGYEVSNPRPPDLSFRRAVRVAQRAFDRLQPHVVVGSSRGGALALHLENQRVPLVLLAPAYRFFGGLPERSVVPPGSVVIHSPVDRLVPLRHSLELARRFPGLAVVHAGETHHLNCPGGRAALRSAVQGIAPINIAFGIHKIPGGGLDGLRGPEVEA